ncbi:hypothetical protein H5407_05415 [Mitsuaria sp. WAJ17]|uniref:effector-associated constant component EACC1 n=1 Tax=Mitsuaria sp. WAJ17 TaxID=2761452 RepID=UPI0015FF00C9|nr:hypothetical protein [Mitsuaria sp. WAJ17]MBB2484661.1 hypothetical protein [Mitsuaria sp. WAJ17]
METLPVHLFKSSFGPFLEELNAHGVRYQMRAVRSGVPMASGEALEIVKVLGSATFWPAVAAVVVAFINKRNGRKVIITTQDKTAVHAEGLSMVELEKVLKAAAHFTAIDPNPPAGSGQRRDDKAM